MIIHPWVRATARRLAEILIVVWGAATLSFVALQSMPGDPVDALLGPNVGASPQLRAQIVSQLNFDRPLVEQYTSFLGRLARGDLGESYRLSRPVFDIIAESFWPTAQLALTSMLIALVLAVVLALGWSLAPRPVRSAIDLIEMIASSVPSFWLGIVAISLFAFQLRWLPAAGSSTPNSVILPAATLALPIGCVLARVLQDSFSRSAAEPFTVTARARGVTRFGVVIRHHLRHAAAPALTLTGWTLAGFLGGAVLIEVVFARSGFGRTLVDAVTARDMPVVTAITVLCAALFATTSLLVDTLGDIADPRLRA